uniref:ATP-dependent Clp protease proteolytic subunit n=1 Tax=Corydalis adunca TaxID=1549776 RepID=A0A7U0KV70_9MAGN|nr:clp protease proteolytic subunit [Corydalis adunca]QQW51844.1 clp protease proteolytic subunit [Corydalis adunca]
MPVGIPKVPFLIPGDEEETWVDLYNRLHRERCLFLGQKMDFEITNTILGLLVFLSKEDKNREHSLLINCPGGWVFCGIALFDMIRFVPPHVNTIGAGKAYSMGSLVLTGGEISQRVALPHAKVLVHQPTSSYLGDTLGELYTDGDEFQSLRDTVIRLYRQRTGQPEWVIVRDLERDSFMTPTEAKIHGIIDLVALPGEWEFPLFKKLPDSYEPETWEGILYNDTNRSQNSWNC